MRTFARVRSRTFEAARVAHQYRNKMRNTRAAFEGSRDSGYMLIVTCDISHRVTVSPGRMRAGSERRRWPRHVKRAMSPKNSPAREFASRIRAAVFGSTSRSRACSRVRSDSGRSILALKTDRTERHRDLRACDALCTRSARYFVISRWATASNKAAGPRNQFSMARCAIKKALARAPRNERSLRIRLMTH